MYVHVSLVCVCVCVCVRVGGGAGCLCMHIFIHVICVCRKKVCPACYCKTLCVRISMFGKNLVLFTGEN